MDFNFVKHSSVSRMIRLLKINFGDTYKKYCDGHYHDDRRLFINIYRQYIRMLLVVDKVWGQSCHLDVIVFHEHDEIFKQLKEIKERFDKIEQEVKCLIS